MRSELARPPDNRTRRFPDRRRKYAEAAATVYAEHAATIETAKRQEMDAACIAWDARKKAKRSDTTIDLAEMVGDHAEAARLRNLQPAMIAAAVVAEQERAEARRLHREVLESVRRLAIATARARIRSGARRCASRPTTVPRARTSHRRVAVRVCASRATADPDPEPEPEPPGDRRSPHGLIATDAPVVAIGGASW